MASADRHPFDSFCFLHHCFSLDDSQSYFHPQSYDYEQGQHYKEGDNYTRSYNYTQGHHYPLDHQQSSRHYERRCYSFAKAVLLMLAPLERLEVRRIRQGWPRYRPQGTRLSVLFACRMALVRSVSCFFDRILLRREPS